MCKFLNGPGPPLVKPLPICTKSAVPIVPAIRYHLRKRGYFIEVLFKLSTPNPDKLNMPTLRVSSATYRTVAKKSEPSISDTFGRVPESMLLPYRCRLLQIIRLYLGAC